MAAEFQPGFSAALATTPARPAIFIAYAHEDRNFVKSLTKELILNNVEVRGDWQLVQGESYETQLRELQLGTDTLVFILSPDSVRSSPCFAELKQAQEQKQRIVPVVYRDVDSVEGTLGCGD
jgi:hypothetical protein